MPGGPTEGLWKSRTGGRRMPPRSAPSLVTTAVSGGATKPLLVNQGEPDCRVGDAARLTRPVTLCPISEANDETLETRSTFEVRQSDRVRRTLQCAATKEVRKCLGT